MKRYTPKILKAIMDECAYCDEDPAGDFVKFSDAKLLQDSHDNLQDAHKDLQEAFNRLQLEHDILQEKYKILNSANSMIDRLYRTPCEDYCECCEDTSQQTHDLLVKLPSASAQESLSMSDEVLDRSPEDPDEALLPEWERVTEDYTDSDK